MGRSGPWLAWPGGTRDPGWGEGSGGRSVLEIGWSQRGERGRPGPGVTGSAAHSTQEVTPGEARGQRVCAPSPCRPEGRAAAARRLRNGAAGRPRPPSAARGGCAPPAAGDARPDPAPLGGRWLSAPPKVRRSRGFLKRMEEEFHLRVLGEEGRWSLQSSLPGRSILVVMKI